MEEVFAECEEDFCMEYIENMKEDNLNKVSGPPEFLLPPPPVYALWSDSFPPSSQYQTCHNRKVGKTNEIN